MLLRNLFAHLLWLSLVSYHPNVYKPNKLGSTHVKVVRVMACVRASNDCLGPGDDGLLLMVLNCVIASDSITAFSTCTRRQFCMGSTVKVM